MIIIGDDHKFNQIELNELPKDIILFHSRYNEEYLINFLLENYKNSSRCKYIIINSNRKMSNELVEILTMFELEGTKVWDIDYFMENYLHKIYIKNQKQKMINNSSFYPFDQIVYSVKRVIDFIMIFLLGIVFLPIILYSIYRIKKESPEGPVIFKQKRVGKYGKEFECFKFRSMFMNAEKNNLPQFSIDDDPRAFKWGKFMRKTRIDELPQLWNVLKGDMHLIGPRPERKYWVDKYKKDIPLYQQRHLVLPGITGWAQVKYKYGSNEKDARQKLMYDLYYIKNWSLWLDLKILFKTVKVVLNV